MRHQIKMNKLFKYGNRCLALIIASVFFIWLHDFINQAHGDKLIASFIAIVTSSFLFGGEFFLLIYTSYKLEREKTKIIQLLQAFCTGFLLLSLILVGLIVMGSINSLENLTALQVLFLISLFLIFIYCLVSVIYFLKKLFTKI